jgi:acyl-CoA thioesterase
VLSLTPTREGDRYRLDVPVTWRQGRTAFGGFVIAALVRAIEDRVADPARPIRSITAVLPGPVVSGAATIDVDVLRKGSAVTSARAALVQDGETRTHVVALACATRRSELAWQEREPPTVPPWHALAPLGAELALPEFSQHFEYRVVEGLAATGNAARVMGWIEAREPGDRRDAAYVAAMVDAWWPAVLPRLPALRPFATIASTLELLALPGDGPLLYRGTAPVCREGYILETRELWTEDRKLVALNHQTLAII